MIFIEHKRSLLNAEDYSSIQYMSIEQSVIHFYDIHLWLYVCM